VAVWEEESEKWNVDFLNDTNVNSPEDPVEVYQDTIAIRHIFNVRSNSHEFISSWHQHFYSKQETSNSH
jgi:hypothetical protein